MVVWRVYVYAWSMCSKLLQIDLLHELVISEMSWTNKVAVCFGILERRCEIVGRYVHSLHCRSIFALVVAISPLTLSVSLSFQVVAEPLKTHQPTLSTVMVIQFRSWPFFSQTKRWDEMDRQLPAVLVRFGAEIGRTFRGQSESGDAWGWQRDEWACNPAIAQLPEKNWWYSAESGQFRFPLLFSLRFSSFTWSIPLVSPARIYSMFKWTC